MNQQRHPILNQWETLHQSRQNCLCIGLDPDINKLPSGYKKSILGMEHFLFDIIDVTQHICIAYKPNISFFEAYGIEGLRVLENVVKHINKSVPVIIDAKRGDIGNTSAMQARFIFDYFGADATTLHPYMGYDSLEPFFNYKNKFNFVLGLTSNPGASDFEKIQLNENQTLSHYVIETVSKWNQKHSNVGVVVGATENKLETVRNIDKHILFLIPGVGAQGGTYKSALSKGKTNKNIALINVSRQIIYSAKTKTTLEKSTIKSIQDILSQ